MRSEGRSGPVMQAHLDEMTGHHDTSEHGDHAAEKDEIGFEDGTNVKDDGSETSEEVAGATETAIWCREMQKQESQKESKKRNKATKKAMRKLDDSICLLFRDEAG
jgi:hypothetical protein